MAPVLRRTRSTAIVAPAVVAPKPRLEQGTPKQTVALKDVSKDKQWSDPDLSDYRNEHIVTMNRYYERIKNPLTAIRAKCVQCCCGSTKEVADCAIKICALWQFRMGENPFNLKTQKRYAGIPQGKETTALLHQEEEEVE